MACTVQFQGSHVAVVVTTVVELASLYNENLELASKTFIVALVYLYFLEVR